MTWTAYMRALEANQIEKQRRKAGRRAPVAKALPHARATCTFGCCSPPPCAIADADVDTRGSE